MTTTIDPSSRQRGLKSQLQPWHLHLSILFIGLSVGAAFIYSIQPRKPPPPQLVYHIMLLDSEDPIVDFTPFVARRRRLLGITLITSPKVPASMNTTFPAMSGPGQSPPPLRLDFVGELKKDRVNTDLTVYFRGLKSIQHISPKDGETQVVELTSNGADKQFHYALIQVETVQASPVKNLILVKPVTTPSASPIPN